jgi:hypothetical protein
VPAVTASSQAGPDPDHALEQPVDSRAYAFAYLIQEPSQLPADFPVDDGFEQALLLPKELVPRFEIPRYVPRLLLAGGDTLSVYSHPSYATTKATIRFHDISHLELRRFLADCSLSVFAPDTVTHLPFHSRDREHVETFFDHLKHRLLAGGKPPIPISGRRNFGSKVDYKFEQIEAIRQVDPEAVVARFFVRPQEVGKSRLFRQEFSWTCGSEIVLTRNQLHLFSDDKDGYRELYGFRASWVPLHNVADIRWDEPSRSITIQLLRDFRLQVLVPDDLRQEAKEFVRFVRSHI